MLPGNQILKSLELLAKVELYDNSIRSSEENVKKNTAKTAEKFSRETYWKPQLNKAEWNLLDYTLDKELETSDNYIDEATKWLYASEKGTKVFAIYGIGDGTKATVLYAAGGNEAAVSAMVLNNAEVRYDRNAGTFDRWIKNIRSKQKRSDSSPAKDAGRNSNVGTDGVDDRASGRNRKGNTDSGRENNDGGVSYSREPETLNELRRQNELKLAQAKLQDAGNESKKISRMFGRFIC